MKIEKNVLGSISKVKFNEYIVLATRNDIDLHVFFFAKIQFLRDNDILLFAS